MTYLIVVSLIWAFSFGLIKGNLSGIDPFFVSAARLGISLLVFLPFWKPGSGSRHFRLKLILIGAVQYGMMYISYIYSYQFLPAYLVALFTIFTPLYVTLLADSFRRQFSGVNFLAALLAVLGTGIIVFTKIADWSVIAGFFILQISNLCFAFGQIYYREVMAAQPQVSDRAAFAWLYLGGFALAALVSAIGTDWSQLSLNSRHVATLLYLGVLASGICFFLWNLGARKVGPGRLAIMNNIKIPLAVAVSLLFFGESADILRLLIGGGIILAALFIEYRYKDLVPTAK